MSFRRPCLTEGCPALSEPGRSRCPDHERARARYKWARRGETGARARFRRRLNTLGGGRCARCGVALPARSLRVDHVVALADGGLDIDGNLQPLCVPCHNRKSADETRRRLRDR